jgi:hypothetical protein
LRRLARLPETATINYCSLSVDQGKQTYVFRFHLQQTNGSLPFLFSFCRKQMGVAVFR